MQEIRKSLDEWSTNKNRTRVRRIARQFAYHLGQAVLRVYGIFLQSEQRLAGIDLHKCFAVLTIKQEILPWLFSGYVFYSMKGTQQPWDGHN
jgi:hypothetical protein